MTDNEYKIGVIGGGSVGLTFAALLADAAKVIIKTRSSEQAREIKTNGISLTERSKTGAEEHKIISGIDATSNNSELDDCDAVIVTVKSYDTEQVAKELSTVLNDTTEILTVQNGLLALEALKRNIKNPDRIFAGVTYIGSTRLDNCSVSVGYNLRTIIDSKATIIGEILHSSKFKFEPTNEIKQAIWDKMAMNTGQNALGAVTNLTLGEMGDSKECLKIGNKLLEELEQVAKGEGVSFNYSLMDKLKDNWKMSHHPSMWQDLQNKKKTEIDAINGAISTLGEKHNIQTPYNNMITSLIKILEVA